jgi:phage-related protein
MYPYTISLQHQTFKLFISILRPIVPFALSLFCTVVPSCCRAIVQSFFRAFKKFFSGVQKFFSGLLENFFKQIVTIFPRFRGIDL